MFGNSGIRIVSIVIGVLFIIGLIFVANRFGSQIKNRFATTEVANESTSPTPTPRVSNPTPTKASFDTSKTTTDQTKGAATTKGGVVPVEKTPKTGPEMLLIPAFVGTLAIGLKLRKLA